MTTKQQQQHESRFLEAPLVRQANGELKNTYISTSVSIRDIPSPGIKVLYVQV